MTDFGFKRLSSNTIDLDKIDMGLYRRLAEMEPHVRKCMACGSCTAVCTGGQFSGMSLRKVILSLQRGTPIRPMLGGCMLCGKCMMVCPRGINTRHLLLCLQRIMDDDRG